MHEPARAGTAFVPLIFAADSEVASAVIEGVSFESGQLHTGYNVQKKVLTSTAIETHAPGRTMLGILHPNAKTTSSTEFRIRKRI